MARSLKVPKKNYKILLGIPSTQYWISDFGVSLACMMSYAAQVKLAPDTASQHILVNNVKGSILPQMRQQIVDHAIKIEATHLLFVDSDMTFPRDTLHRLLAWNQPVVACNCCTKVFPTTTTARLKDPDNPGGKCVFSLKNTGLQRVWRVGTGVMLINVSVFKKLQRPYFSLKWAAEKADQYVGEDWALCRLLEEADIPVFVDHGLSQEIGHVGTFNYNMTCVVSKEEEETVRKALMQG